MIKVKKEGSKNVLRKNMFEKELNIIFRNDYYCDKLKI